MKVYVTGSGFSVTAGLPLSRQVLTQIFKGSSSELGQMYQWIRAHLFANQNNWSNQTDITEVISRLDLFQRYCRDEQQLKVISAIEEGLLAEFIDLLQPERYNPTSIYDCFVSMLCPDDTLITFNYDLIVEQASHRNNICFYYPWTYNQHLPAQKILKLHGSINMYFCPECDYTYLFKERITRHPKLLKDIGCQLMCMRCSTQIPLKQLVVAPTLFKSYSLTMLQTWWYQAFKDLSQAREIVFIGYSLPPADLLTRQLLAWSFQENTNLQRVLLVNGPQHQAKELKAIYGNLLVNTHQSFAQWVTLEHR